MLQSFFVYITTGVLLFILGNISYERDKENNVKKRYTPFWTLEVFLLLVVFATLAGLRWNVGVDHLSYLNNYLTFANTGFDRFEDEPVFSFLTKILAENNIHFFYYFSIIAFLQLLFIYNTFKKEKYLYPFLGIIILFGPEFLSWMNGIRQMLAATIFFWAIQFIHKRQLYKFVLSIVVAGLIHKSAIILIVFYFIPQRDYFKSRTLTFILAGISIFLGNVDFWIENMNRFADLLVVLDYSEYSEKIGELIEDNQTRNIGPRRLSILLSALITIWFSPKLKKIFNNSYFLNYYNLAILGFLLYNLFGNLHHIFIRPISYLTIFSIASTAYLLTYLKIYFKKMSFVFFIVLFISLSYLPLSIIADDGKGIKDFTNYRFYWFHNIK